MPGIYLHGLLEDPALLVALLGVRPERPLDVTFETLADVIEHHLDTDRIHALLVATRPSQETT